MRVIAALLAAGAGSRFRGDAKASQDVPHKLVADLHGLPLWRHSLDHLLDAGLDTVVVVTGAAAIDADVAAAAAARAADVDVEVVRNDAWATGQASSLQVAVAAARRHHAEALVVGLADQPFVTAAAWRAVADAPPSCSLVVATYDGRVGPNPVRIGAEHWSALPTSGDEGARALLRTFREHVCQVACVGSAVDIDTPEDLARWTSS